jgi:hypothetical protein
MLSGYDQSEETGAATIPSAMGKTCGPVCKTIPAAMPAVLTARADR